jgi:hypothetical protein
MNTKILIVLCFIVFEANSLSAQNKSYYSLFNIVNKGIVFSELRPLKTVVNGKTATPKVAMHQIVFIKDSSIIETILPMDTIYTQFPNNNKNANSHINSPNRIFYNDSLLVFANTYETLMYGISTELVCYKKSKEKWNLHYRTPLIQQMSANKVLGVQLISNKIIQQINVSSKESCLFIIQNNGQIKRFVKNEK